MSGRVINRPRPSIDQGDLEAVRLALAEKLRRQYQQTDAFIEDVADELLDQAFIEYVEAVDRGDEIRSQVGWLITTATRRAIDRIRRESTGHEFFGEGAETVIETAEDPAPSVEALAAQHIDAVEVHEAVAELTDRQREALSLEYWEDLTTREAAEAMGTSKTSFLRCRDSAMKMLRERFGVEVGDPIEKHLAIEAGFAAWALLAVGQPTLAVAESVAHHAVGAAGEGIGHPASWAGDGASWIGGTIRNVAGWVGGRARDFAAKVSSAAEPLAALPTPARVACGASAAIVCGAGVVAGPALVNSGGESHQDHPAIVRPADPASKQATLAPAVPAPSPATHGGASSPTRAAKQGAATERRNPIRTDSEGRHYRRKQEEQARSQSIESQSGPTPSYTPPPGEAPTEPAPESPPPEAPSAPATGGGCSGGASQFDPCSQAP